MRTLALTRLMVVAGLLAVPSLASAHIGFRRSEPSRGDTLTTAPARVTLWFTTRPQLGFSRVRLVGPAGEVALGPLVSDTGNAVVAGVGAALAAGGYTVRWQTASADGHIIRGEFGFTVATQPGTPSPVAEHAASQHVADPEAHAEHDEYRWVRWMEFVALVTVLGVLGFRHGVLPPLAARGVSTADASDRARRLGQNTLILYFLASIQRLYAESAAVHGTNSALDPTLLWAMLRQTTWGIGWLTGLAGALALFVGWRLSKQNLPGGTTLEMTGGLAMALATALTGHAAAGQPVLLSVGADTLHVLAAGVWTGGLLIVLLAGLPAMKRVTGDVHAATAALVNSFHPVALFCAILVVLTGATSSWLRLGTVDALWGSAFGRTLLVKLSLFGLVALTGFINAVRVRRQLGSESGSRRIRVTAMIELAFAALLLAATSWLVVTPVPIDDVL